MPEICSGIGVWANEGERRRRGECLRDGSGYTSGCKEIRGEGWSWVDGNI